jgi:hypothetical protein
MGAPSTNFHKLLLKLEKVTKNSNFWIFLKYSFLNVIILKLSGMCSTT